MKFTCDRCDAQYMISDEKVGPNGVKVRCKKCSHVILVRRAAENGAAAAEAPVPAPAPAPGGSGEGLEAELGQAFDNVFGDGPAKAPTPAPDPDATQAVSSEEAANVLARSASPEPAATEWYVAIGQAQVGPLPLVEVRRKWEAGDIGPDSLVWRPGMGDWAPLTGVSDLAAYLAPVPRGAARPQPAAAAAPVVSRTVAAAPAESRRIADVSWKPVGASALAALASEEIAGQPAEQKPEARPVVSAKSLVDGLPEGGGVDPTGAIPLQIKALEETGEAPVAKSTVARGAERIRKKRSSTRALTMVIVLLVLVLVGGGGYVGYDLYLRPRLAPVAPPPPMAATEKPAPAEKPTPPAKPAEPATAAATPPAAAGEPAAAATPPATPPAAATEAAAAPPPAAKEPEKPKPEPARPAREPARTARAEKKAHEPPPRAERVARAEPAPKPQPAPAKKKGGDLLDFDANDSALDEALGGEKKSGGRSVYVPPAAGGADGLPERVTDSQVNETIMTRVSALQGCLADNKSGQSGVLKMRWAISPDGAVQNLKCITPESANTPFAQCVTGVLKGLRFPKTAQGRSEVTFPFKF